METNNVTNSIIQLVNSIAPTSPAQGGGEAGGGGGERVIDHSCELYRIFINTIIAFLCLFGILGNIIVFVVFWKDTVKTSASFLFQALAVVDTLFLIAVCFLFVPRSIEYYSHYLQAYVHVYIFPFAMISQTAAMWGTVVIAVNRFIAVCMPFQAARWCTVQQAQIQFSILIICAVVYCLPEFFRGYLATVVADPQQPNNSIIYNRVELTEFGKSDAYRTVYKNIMYLIFLLTLPLVIVIYLNVRLIVALNALHKKRSEMQSLRQQQDNNVTLVLIIVIFVFIFCQAPALVNQIFWNIDALKDTGQGCAKFHAYYREITNMLVTFNSAVNFVIYYLFNTRFRQVFHETFTCLQAHSSLSSANNQPAKGRSKPSSYQRTQKMANYDETHETLL